MKNKYMAFASVVLLIMAANTASASIDVLSIGGHYGEESGAWIKANQ